MTTDETRAGNPARPAFLQPPSVYVDSERLKVTDRTADLGSAIVHLSLETTMHVQDAGQARALAAAFTKAAELLDAAAAREGGT